MARKRAFYDVIYSGAISWADANAQALELGNGWHLATITSAAENQFVTSLWAGDSRFSNCCRGNNSTGPWIGAFRTSFTSTDWQWVTGEPFVYTNWGPGEPASNGNRLAYFGFQSQLANDRWNDMPDGGFQGLFPTGYVVERNGPTLPLAERIALGLGPHIGSGGWFAVRNDRSSSFSQAAWGRLPWSLYGAGGGGLRLAAGDVDGDGLAEIVAGLDRGGGGWLAVFDDATHGHALTRWVQVQWSAYNAANGEVWPAVGDLDGDGRAEIVAGLGAGGHGWFEVFDDAAAGFSHLAWRQVDWPAYTALASSVVHPAIGNVDGEGASEIILGLGTGSRGWMEVVHGTAGGYGHRSWFQVGWPAYAAAVGTTFPAVGDVDGDGRGEIVAGLGAGGGGWIQVFDDAVANYAPVTWRRVSWSAYNLGPGETHPAVGNVDGDPAAEIVIGLAPFAGQGGWFEILDNQSSGFAILGWRNLGWLAFRAAGGATYPAIGRFR